MRHALWIVLLAGATAFSIGACSEDNGFSAPTEKALDFTIVAPNEVPTKTSGVTIEARITRADLVDYPLTVTFEEANFNQGYAMLATKTLAKPEDTIASIQEDVARDPIYRVTVRDAAGVPTAVTKTHMIDVLDYP